LDSEARRFYFVQDYEPYFFPIGTNHTLAENSYRFGFYGITAGGWLSKKLSKEHGMQTDYFDFAANKSLYRYTNSGKRKEVFFYARPATARRGFELGVAALEIFHKKHPEYTINLAGADVSGYDVPFPYRNLKTLELSELGDVYNRCSCALVMSLTNMSLLPLELLACGTIPVVNDGENNRLVSNNPFIAYADPSPLALAEKMSEIVNMPQLPRYAKKASQSVPDEGWDGPGNKFVQIVNRELGRG
jgi:glycosyltransferase involved in cell wall biosynthesis